MEVENGSTIVGSAIEKSLEIDTKMSKLRLWTTQMDPIEGKQTPKILLHLVPKIVPIDRLKSSFIFIF